MSDQNKNIRLSINLTVLICFLTFFFYMYELDYLEKFMVIISVVIILLTV